jgi:hypothetical protein
MINPRNRFWNISKLVIIYERAIHIRIFILDLPTNRISEIYIINFYRGLGCFYLFVWLLRKIREWLKNIVLWGTVNSMKKRRKLKSVYYLVDFTKWFMPVNTNSVQFQPISPLCRHDNYAVSIFSQRWIPP